MPDPEIQDEVTRVYGTEFHHGMRDGEHVLLVTTGDLNGFAAIPLKSLPRLLESVVEYYEALGVIPPEEEERTSPSSTSSIFQEDLITPSGSTSNRIHPSERMTFIRDEGHGLPVLDSDRWE